ncbi:MAG: CpaF family protein [Planctomycetota bacterium]|jgi:pilus assembly protein CpaF
MDNRFEYIISTFLAPVKSYLDDPEVSEVLINRHDEIYVERNGVLAKVPDVFETRQALVAAANNIAQFVGRVVNERHPTMEARLPDGSRVHVIVPPCARGGTYVAIRKFQRAVFNAETLLRLDSISKTFVRFLEIAVEARKNIVFSGGSGTGKTSLLNFVSSFIPEGERVLVIEDATELQLRKGHVLYLEVKMADKDGLGEVPIRELVRASLRMRPDRIIVGEVRGGETLDMLQAMNTGHAGSMTTIHANSPKDSLFRLETTALMGGVDLTLRAVRAQITSAVDLLVHISRYPDGSRKVSLISELSDLDGKGEYVVKDLFRFHPRGRDSAGKIRGAFLPTGKTPGFLEELVRVGFTDAPGLFRAPEGKGDAR